MKFIGITGGIGSGKSVVSGLLTLEGIDVYDSDSNAKRIIKDSPEVKAQITQLLGSGAYDSSGELNKPYIAEKIFADKSLLASMNSIVHPAVWDHYVAWSQKKEKEGKQATAFESAILYESGLYSHFDQIWWVEAPLELRIERACRRDNASREKIEARIRNQKPAPQQADAVIWNDDCHSLIEQVHNLVTTIILP